MDGQQQPIEAQNQEIHVIEEDSQNRNDQQSDTDYPLEEALVAWKEVNARVRNIGHCLLAREVACLKKSADEITRRGIEANCSEQHGSSDDPRSLARCSEKRRRVSSFEDEEVPTSGVLQSEKELLMNRMNRMRRINNILANLNSSHIQLETEIRGMIAESEALETMNEISESNAPAEQDPE